ncbi:tetratricopeptide repeat protein [Roseobacteraceae bacterium NS-SX3]
MIHPGRALPARLAGLAAAFAVAGVAACAPGGLRQDKTSPWAPGHDVSAPAKDGLATGHRLMAAGEYELALEAFNRAALTEGLSADVLSGLGSANLGLRRLGQAETLLRRAAEAAPDWPEVMNNLGVVLLERQKFAEAAEVLKRAYALDNGESDAIRDNLRLALAKLDEPGHTGGETSGYSLVQRGGGSYLLRTTP